MNRLSKAQAERKRQLTKKIEELAGELVQIAERANEVLDVEKAKVETALNKLNEVIAEANELRQEVHDDVQSFIDEKSEKWLFSERGQDCVHFAEEWEDELPEVSMVMPQEFEEPEVAAGDLLAECPEAY
jgi:chromosome segregation ATPase